MDRDIERQIATDMYKREHDRWYHWALFFFGSIASVFVVTHQSNGAVPVWAASLAASLVSLFWTAAADDILMTSHAWELTIHELENREESSARAFTLYWSYLNKNPWWTRVSLYVEFRRPRLTFILMWLGALTSVGFLILTMALWFGWTVETGPHSAGVPCVF